MAGVMTHLVFFALRVLCGLKYTVEGRENLPAGNHVIFMKHSSTWETYAIMILFQPLVWVMKREILWIPFVGWGCMLARCIAIDRKAGTGRGEPGAGAGQGPAWSGSARGSWCFPKARAWRRAKRAATVSSGTLLAAQEKRQIVPVAHNAGYFWPRRGLLKKRGTIRVIIGPPIEAAGPRRARGERRSPGLDRGAQQVARRSSAMAD